MSKIRKLFMKYVHGYVYKLGADLMVDDYICFPVEVDTEFQRWLTDVKNPETPVCENLTTQTRSIGVDNGAIYAHPENTVARHKRLKHGFCVLDYLEDLGHSVSLEKHECEHIELLPILQFDIYAFFAVAELVRMFTGDYRDDILQFVISPGNTGIKQKRRLTTYTQCGNKYFDWIEPLNWLLTIDNRIFRVRIAIYDTCAVHGKTSYKAFCTNSNIELKYKDNYTHEQKLMMKNQYINDGVNFDLYALGDLYNHTALIGNMDNFKIIYKTLDLLKYFTPPKLTIGSTVSRLFEAVIKSEFDAEPDSREIIRKLCKYGSADWIKRKTTSTACLNAKVDGGRCRNNRPIDTLLFGVLCDIDICGCYGEGLRIQTYPLGIPCIIDYPIYSDRNKYQTLRKFLSKYGDELVPGLWQARVELREGYTLEYKQDYLISWFPPKDISRMPTDSEIEETDQWWTVDNVGETKIFTNEIVNAVITHDFIQWLKYICTPRQRKELLDNLLVKTAMYYPKSERVNNVEDLQLSHALHNGVNTTEYRKYKGSTRKQSYEHECHKWYGINMGKLLINQLLIERDKYPKKTPLNDLYKLVINTVYGDMVSPFFMIGNVVVGNNITARARGLAWFMEKGFHGFQSITDGCVFDINKVLYPQKNRRISGEIVVNLYADKAMKNHRFAPIIQEDDLCVTDNYKIELVDYDGVPGITTTYKNQDLSVVHQPKEAINWISNHAMAHLQKLFPNVDILHQETTNKYGVPRIGQFEFEAKGFYDTGIFHGSANYRLGYQGKFKYAMRSYTKKSHRSVELVDGNLELHKDFKPSEFFLDSLMTPHNIPRSKVYIKDRILKCGDYKNNYQRWRGTQVYPGCTIEITGILHEFSLSQFTFQTYNQYKKWKQEFEGYLRKYGQTYEMFYLLENERLDYQQMVIDVDAAIRNGDINYFGGKNKSSLNAYRKYSKHQETECLDKIRTMLKLRYGGYTPSEYVLADDRPMPYE